LEGKIISIFGGVTFHLQQKKGKKGGVKKGPRGEKGDIYNSLGNKFPEAKGSPGPV